MSKKAFAASFSETCWVPQAVWAYMHPNSLGWSALAEKKRFFEPQLPNEYDAHCPQVPRARHLWTIELLAMGPKVWMHKARQNILVKHSTNSVQNHGPSKAVTKLEDQGFQSSDPSHFRSSSLVLQLAGCSKQCRPTCIQTAWDGRPG